MELPIKGDMTVRVEARSWLFLRTAQRCSSVYLKGSCLDIRQVGMQIQSEPVKQLVRNVVEPLNQNSVLFQQVCLLTAGMRLENVLSSSALGVLHAPQLRRDLAEDKTCSEPWSCCCGMEAGKEIRGKRGGSVEHRFHWPG